MIIMLFGIVCVAAIAVCSIARTISKTIIMKDMDKTVITINRDNRFKEAEDALDKMSELIDSINKDKK